MESDERQRIFIIENASLRKSQLIHLIVASDDMAYSRPKTLQPFQRAPRRPNIYDFELIPCKFNYEDKKFHRVCPENNMAIRRLTANDFWATLLHSDKTTCAREYNFWSATGNKSSNNVTPNQEASIKFTTVAFVERNLLKQNEDNNSDASDKVDFWQDLPPIPQGRNRTPQEKPKKSYSRQRHPVTSHQSSYDLRSPISSNGSDPKSVCASLYKIDKTSPVKFTLTTPLSEQDYQQRIWDMWNISNPVMLGLLPDDGVELYSIQITEEMSPIIRSIESLIEGMGP